MVHTTNAGGGVSCPHAPASPRCLRGRGLASALVAGRVRRLGQRRRQFHRRAAKAQRGPGDEAIDINAHAARQAQARAVRSAGRSTSSRRSGTTTSSTGLRPPTAQVHGRRDAVAVHRRRDGEGRRRTPTTSRRRRPTPRAASRSSRSSSTRRPSGPTARRSPEKDYQTQWKALRGKDSKYQVAVLDGLRPDLERQGAARTRHEVIATFDKPFADWMSLCRPLYPAKYQDTADPTSTAAT